MHTASSTVTTDEAAARLRTIIVSDVAATLGGSAFTAIVYVVTDATRWLLVTSIFIAVVACAMAIALVPLRRGDSWSALLWLAASNWAAALWGSAIATFSWPIMIQAALLPAAVAASIVGGRRLTALWAVSLGVACGATALGLLQDVTDLSDDVPEWTKTTVLLVFLPVMSGLIVLTAVQTSIRLQSALDRSIEAQGQLQDQAAEMRRSRARVVAATDRERRRIERDLHDGAQSRLVAINLRLRRARTLLETDPAAAAQSLEQLRDELHVAQTELRDLARGVYPTVLTQHGLAPAIQSAADRSPVPVRVALDDVGRHHDEIESAVYFCILEAVQNATKHADCRSIDIALGRRDDSLHFTVRDDGVGFDVDLTDRSGLENLRDRIGAVGGDIAVESEPGSGTSVRGWVPVSGRDSGRDSAGPEGPAEHGM